MKELKIVNIIHIGEKEVNWNDLTPEEKKDIALRLNAQALEPLGYRRAQEHTA